MLGAIEKYQVTIIIIIIRPETLLTLINSELSPIYRGLFICDQIANNHISYNKWWWKIRFHLPPPSPFPRV